MGEVRGRGKKVARMNLEKNLGRGEKRDIRKNSENTGGGGGGKISGIKRWGGWVGVEQEEGEGQKKDSCAKSHTPKGEKVGEKKEIRGMKGKTKEKERGDTGESDRRGIKKKAGWGQRNKGKGSREKGTEGGVWGASGRRTTGEIMRGYKKGEGKKKKGEGAESTNAKKEGKEEQHNGVALETSKKQSWEWNRAWQKKRRKGERNTTHQAKEEK